MSSQVPLSQPPLNLGAETRELIDNAIAQRRASSDKGADQPTEEVEAAPVGSTQSGSTMVCANSEHHLAQLAADDSQASLEEEPVGSRKRARSESDVGSNGSETRKRANNLEVGGLALTAPAFPPSRPAAAPQAAPNLKAAPNCCLMDHWTEEVERSAFLHLSQAKQNLAHWTNEVERRHFRLAAVEEVKLNGQLLKNQSQSAHKEGGPGSQRLTKKDPNIYTVFVKCWVPRGDKSWKDDMDFQSMTRRPRYICERYSYLTTVGDLKAKIVDTTGGMALLTGENMQIFFRGKSLARFNDAVLHSLIDDEVIVHVCAKSVWQAKAMVPAVRQVSKQLWSMA